MLTKGYGLDPYPWQSDILYAWMGLDKYGKWAALRCGLLVPRQNGKTMGPVGIRELYGLVILGERILHTAHQQKTATEAFRELKAIFRHPDLAKLLDGDPLSALGREEIRLKNGGVIKYIARTRVSGLGFTADLLVLDEAQELTDAQIDALQPVISAPPLGNPQTIMVGAAPGADSPAEVFRRYRRDGHKGKDEDLSWHEWSVDKIGDISDRSRWEDTNPSLGLRLKASVINVELKTLSEDGFARQRLNWWPDSSSERLVARDLWESLAIKEPPSEGKLVYGVRFSADGEVVTLAVALKPDEGKSHIEVIAHRSTHAGVKWLVAWLCQRWKKAALIVIDGKSGSQSLVDRLYEKKVSKKVICQPRPSDVIASTNRTLTAINEEEITHYNQPVLNEAACNARKRPIGKDGGWGWGGIEGVDVTPIEAASLAYWGVMTTKRDPRRKARIA